MKANVLKKFYLTGMFMLLCVCLYAQETKTHTVQPGETLARIAQMYGISESALLDANPTVKDYFYTGLKLTIPVERTRTDQNEVVMDKNGMEETRQVIETNEFSNHAVDNRKWATDFTFGVLFPEKNEADSAIGFMAQLQAISFVSPSFYLGLGLGYKYREASAKLHTYDSNLEVKAKTKILYMPIRAGYKLDITPKTNVNFFTGPHVNYVLSCKEKMKDGYYEETINLKKTDGFKSLYFDWTFGLSVSLGSIGIYGLYGLDISHDSDEKVGYFSVGFCSSF